MLTPLRTSPLLFVIDDFLDAESLARVGGAVDPETLSSRSVPLERNATGLTAEVPVASDPALDDLARRITALIGVDNALVPHTMRVRHAGAGESHPPHLDEYEIDGSRLQVTAHLYLSAVEGGATPFARAVPPVAIEPRPGRLAVWFNYRPDGRPDPASLHAIAPIASGARTGLTWFVYATDQSMRQSAIEARQSAHPPLVASWPAEDAPAGVEHAVSAESAREPDGEPDGAIPLSLRRRKRLYCLIEEATPDTTRASLRRSCDAHNVRYVELNASRLDPRRPPLEPGDLLYCPATSGAADRGERQLWQPGVVTFHRRAEGPFAATVDQTLAFARAGLPTPRAVWITTTDREALKGLLEHVGGLPAIVRVDGGEGGVGVMRADSLPAFFGLVDLLLSRALVPRLVSYVPDAMHYRLVVVGDRVVTMYRNPLKADDFRSEPSDREADYGLTPTEEMANLAVDASRVAGSELAGVDLIEHGPSGRLYVLEANSPCYFAQAESFDKADVGGAMVAHLLAKARAVAD